MEERVRLGMKVVITTYRKHGNGAKGSGRKGQSGKRGIIYHMADDGTKKKLAKAEEPTFKELSKKLFDTGLIPRDVTINRSGTTEF